MPKIDPEQERQRLSKLYAEMDDEDLETVGRDPAALTEIAFGSVQAEMDRRNLDWPGKGMSLTEFRDKTPTPRFGPGDTPVVLRKYRDMPEAMTDRMVLDAAGIECYLYDENLVRLDWFISGGIGGVKLVVRDKELEEAAKILDERFPDEMEGGAGI